MAKKEIMNACHLYPMPLVLIGAKHEGRVNFMPAAFCGILNINPPIIALGLSKMHFTSRGIEEKWCFQHQSAFGRDGRSNRLLRRGIRP